MPRCAPSSSPSNRLAASLHLLALALTLRCVQLGALPRVGTGCATTTDVRPRCAHFFVASRFTGLEHCSRFAQLQVWASWPPPDLQTDAVCLSPVVTATIARPPGPTQVCAHQLRACFRELSLRDGRAFCSIAGRGSATAAFCDRKCIRNCHITAISIGRTCVSQPLAAPRSRINTRCGSMQDRAISLVNRRAGAL